MERVATAYEGIDPALSQCVSIVITRGEPISVTDERMVIAPTISSVVNILDDDQFDAQ